jgi:hypothetical protein
MEAVSSILNLKSSHFLQFAEENHEKLQSGKPDQVYNPESRDAKQHDQLSVKSLRTLT